MPLTDDQRERLREDLELEKLQKRQAGQAFMESVRAERERLAALPEDQREPAETIEFPAVRSPGPRPRDPEGQEVAPIVRRRGRPVGTKLPSKKNLVVTFARLWREWGRRPTQSELADNTSPKVHKRTIENRLKDYNLPWPIE